ASLRYWLTAVASAAARTAGLYSLPLHDALPISEMQSVRHHRAPLHGSTHPSRAQSFRRRLFILCQESARLPVPKLRVEATPREQDRKSTRLNSSHVKISYAVFCLKNKNWTTVSR